MIAALTIISAAFIAVAGTYMTIKAHRNPAWVNENSSIKFEEK